MIRLMRLAGRYAWLAVLAAAFVGFQAFFELQLPLYMSELVNIGLLQQGLTDAAPARITDRDLQMISCFMSDEDRLLVSTSYNAGPGGAYSISDSTLDRSALSDAFDEAEWTLLYLIEDTPGTPDIGNVPDARSTPDLAEVNIDAVREAADTVLPSSRAELEEARRLAARVPAELRTITGTAFAVGFMNAAGLSAADAQRAYLLSKGGAMALCGVAAAACSFAVCWCAARAASGAESMIRAAVFDRARRAAAPNLTQSELISRSTSDITVVRTAMESGIRVLVFGICMGVGGALMGARLSVPLDWVLWAAATGSIVVTVHIFRITRPRYRTVQAMIDRLNLVTAENARGAAVIRTLGAQERQEARFDDANERLASTQLGINRILSFLSPSYTLAMNAACLIVVWCGAQLVNRSVLEVGSVIAFVQYATIVVGAFALIAGMFVIIPRAEVSARRILEVADPRQVSPAPSTDSEAHEARLAARDVSFQYDGEPTKAIRDVSLHVEPGQVTAIIGSTGSGKTTLMRLLGGSLHPQQGTIQVAGRRSEDVGQIGHTHSPHIYLLDCPQPVNSSTLWKHIAERNAADAVIIGSVRVSDVRRADRIYVLEHGQITGCGTHDELLQASKLYARLARAEQEDDAGE